MSKLLYAFLLCVVCLVAVPMTFIMIRSPRRVSLEGEVVDCSTLRDNITLSLLSDALPREARMIHYRVRPYAGSICADFVINKRTFDEWSVKHGWQPTAIGVAKLVNSCRSSRTQICVTNGFWFAEDLFRKDQPDVLLSSLRVVFDADVSRCYYRFTKGD